MTKIRSEPCSACPYRCDVPSGVWAEHEYDKLVEYDAPTASQPMATFACHATPDHHCHGWAVTHSSRGHDRELLALRVWPPDNDIPESDVIFFGSGAEAAEHGKADLEDPSLEAQETAQRLVRKYERLRKDDDG